MRQQQFIASMAYLILFPITLSLQAGVPGKDPSNWKIQEVYNYLSIMGDDLSKNDIDGYCKFIIESQDSKYGIFSDKFGKTIYSVKAFHLLKKFGYKPKYPLSVTQHVGKDLHYSLIEGEIISEKSTPETFRKWLDKTRKDYDAYPAGSLMGHFIAPHVMNLQNEEKKIEESPFIPVFQKWLIDNQGENGFWNRPDDTDFNGWNGVMKMDSALRSAKIIIPKQEQMILTVLKYQDPEDGNFTAAGGCTNHNALHTIRQWSKRNELLKWQSIFLSMEHFANCSERRLDPVTGYFRVIPGFNNKPDFRATELVRMAFGNIIDYCKILLDPANQEKLLKQKPANEEARIDQERIRKLLVRAVGLNTLAVERIKSHVQEEHKKQQN